MQRQRYKEREAEAERCRQRPAETDRGREIVREVQAAAKRCIDS